MEQQTQAADAEFDELFSEEAGATDAAMTSGEANALTLDELNAATKRTFGSKEEAIKHIQNLNSFAGDQRRVELEKKAKEADKLRGNNGELEERLSRLEREAIQKDFLIANPSAKDNLDLVEAIAEKKGLTFQQAWEELAPKFNANVDNGDSIVGVKSKQRIAPSQPQRVSELKEQFLKTGRGDIAEQLVAEWDNQ